MKKRNLRFLLIVVTLISLGAIFFSRKHVNEQESGLVRKSTSALEFNTLVWSDEFNGNGALDSEKWFLQTQLPPGGSWWGGLLQHYTNKTSNAYMADGHMHLVAKKESFTDQGETKQYTAARLNSKFSFTYGKVEVRAKLPKGVGTWPAIWMLNTNINEAGAYWEQQGFGKVVWPECGEIDILEHWGNKQDFVQSAVHNASSYGHLVKNLGGMTIKGVSDDFHTYILEWTKEKMVFTVDGETHYQYAPKQKNSDTWPFDTDYYILFNIAIEPDIDPNFSESAMLVDYIRVFQ